MVERIIPLNQTGKMVEGIIPLRTHEPNEILLNVEPRVLDGGNHHVHLHLNHNFNRVPHRSKILSTST